MWKTAWSNCNFSAFFRVTGLYKQHLHGTMGIKFFHQYYTFGILTAVQIVNSWTELWRFFRLVLNAMLLFDEYPICHTRQSSDWLVLFCCLKAHAVKAISLLHGVLCKLKKNHIAGTMGLRNYVEEICGAPFSALLPSCGILATRNSVEVSWGISFRQKLCFAAVLWLLSTKELQYWGALFRQK